MVEVAWQAFIQPDPNVNYVAYAAYAERKSVFSYFNMLRKANRVSKQLSTAKGLVGFTARLEFSSKKIVQLAVFENQEALEAFAHSGQHALCIQDANKMGMNWFKKAFWSIPGSAVPPKIDEAISRIQNQTK